MVLAGLVAGTLATANPAQAEVTGQPVSSHFYPLQPSPALQVVAHRCVSLARSGTVLDSHRNDGT
jgi:hypothetical protein